MDDLDLFFEVMGVDFQHDNLLILFALGPNLYSGVSWIPNFDFGYFFVNWGKY